MIYVVVVLQTELRKLLYKLQPYLLHYCKPPIDPLVSEYARHSPKLVGTSTSASHVPILSNTNRFYGKVYGWRVESHYFWQVFVFAHFFLKLPTLSGFLWIFFKPQNPDVKKLWKCQTLLVTLKDF